MSGEEQAPAAVEISFAASGGTGPLTWGQRIYWTKFMEQGDDWFNLSHTLAVPSGRSVPDVADAIRTLVERHPGLVTRFPRYTTDPYQHVAAHGTIRLTVHAATADEAERVVARVRDEIGRNFRHEDEWPVRFALVLADGAPRHLVMEFSHLVIDGAGLWIVVHDVGRLLDGQALPPTEGTWSPLALAAYEQGTEGKARSASAMRHWRNEMLECPSTIFDFAILDPEPFRFWRFRMVSSAVAVAARRIATLHRCSTSAVILAALAAVLGHYTGHSRMPMLVVASNRWRPQTSRTCSPIVQPAMFSVTVDDRSFGDFATEAWKRALMSYQAAAYDPLDLERETKTAQRLIGAHIGRDVSAIATASTAACFNDVRRTDDWPQQPVAADTETALTELCASTGLELADQWNDVGMTFFFSLYKLEEHATVELDFDTAFIPGPTARQMLTGIESLLVQAAGRAVRSDEVGAITGIAPVVRGGGWVRVDGVGWTELAKVANLLAEVPDVMRCAVFVESERLVAYLVGTRSDVTPELVHNEVCERFGGRTDVKAPQHYVLCAGPPADDSHAAWRSQPVLMSGSGRC